MQIHIFGFLFAAAAFVVAVAELWSLGCAPMRWSFAIGAVLVVLGFLLWRFDRGEVLSASTRARLVPGMTTNEVLAILGPPSQVSGREWIYRRPLMYNVGLVFFDESDHFRSAIND